MEPLQTWWATELYPSKDEDTFGVAGDFEVVLAADAQATIAALRGRVEAHERAYQEGHPSPCTLGSYCPYCEIERRVAQLTQRTAELEAANKHCEIIEERKAEAYKEVEIQLLDKADLQAELERVRGELAEVAVLTKEIKDEFDGCTHECERCGESDPMITFDIYRTVVQLAALAATSQEGQHG